MQWGDRWVSGDRPPVVVTDQAGRPVDAVGLGQEGRPLAPRDLRFSPGVGAEPGTRAFLAAMTSRVSER
jgi:hypothetical protein